MVSWSAELTTKLFLGIIKQCDMKPDMEKLAQELTEAAGETVTPKAVNERLFRLKKQAREGSLGGSASNKAVPTTTKVSKPKLNGAKRKAEKKTLQNGFDDDDEEKIPEQKPIKTEIV